ncbi:MAG: DUF819 family protein [Saprospiraceae bacterium]|nr:DUF819 family protein [Saprospiraceae bacterium]
MMITPDHSIVLFLILLLASLFGMFGERRGWFKSISGVLVTILIMSLLVTLDVVPSASDPDTVVPVYDFIFTYFVPVAIPLLLFQVQIGRLFREAGRMLGIFFIGSLGVVIGACTAAGLLALGPEEYKVAGVLIGTYTGGSVNFMGVAATLDFLQSPLFAPTIAVDNVFTNFYIMFLFLLPSAGWLVRRYAPVPIATDGAKDEQEARVFNLESMTTCLTIAFAVFALARLTAPIIAGWLGTDINLEILLITIYMIALANGFPGFMRQLSTVAFDLGMFFLYVFLAVIGAAADLREIFTSAPGILLFAALVLVVHFLVSMVAGKLLGYSLKEILVASCANAGGPSVAAPMAASFGMRQAVTPAILVAIMGYVIGTFLGVTTGLWMRG